MTRSATPASAPRTVLPLPSRPQARGAQPLGRRVFEELVRLALFGTSAVTILTTLGIVGVLVFETVSFFREVSLWRFLTDTQWTPLFVDKHFGILVLASATVLTSAIALAVALPIGLLAAIYLSEFAAPKTRRTLKPILEVLAGVPTVVYGYFALLFVTPMLKLIFPDISGFNALSAGLVMGVMILPLVISLSEDALFAVPTGLRDAGLALGSTRCEVSLKIVVPAALSGIVAAVILAISRAVGETMIVAIAAGQSPRLTLNPFVPVETMTAYIVQVSLGDTPHGTLEYQTIFAVGMALFLMTLVLNLLGDRLVRRYRERYA
ncbi:MAG: phosphate ABC transporter permease subunit PstC [bacterium]|nr:phosphate ABC transporter permease subunit PstC [bacterium]